MGATSFFLLKMSLGENPQLAEMDGSEAEKVAMLQKQLDCARAELDEIVESTEGLPLKIQQMIRDKYLRRVDQLVFLTQILTNQVLEDFMRQLAENHQERRLNEKLDTAIKESPSLRHEKEIYCTNLALAINNNGVIKESDQYQQRAKNNDRERKEAA